MFSGLTVVLALSHKFISAEINKGIIKVMPWKTANVLQ
jgi:hypothetical protein